MIPGQYEIRYYDTDSRALTATQVEVTPVDVSLAPPAEAEVGGPVPIEWTGPDYARDYIAVSEPGQDGYVNYVYTRGGSPAALVMPGTPGEYEIRYVAAQDNTVLARAMIAVTDAAATITAPETAMAGSDITVGWTGPGNERDYISVAQPDADPNQYSDYAYTRAPEVALNMPAEPGAYELRYILREGQQTLESRTITLTEPVATIDAPADGVKGTQVKVQWSGPGASRDYVSIARPDVADTEYESYAYARGDGPLSLRLPDETGIYELRYVLGTARKVIARQPFEVRLPFARLAVPATVSPGASVQVAWQGPGGGSDRIVLVPAGGEADQAVSDVQISAGNPLTMTMPEAVGVYELLYLSGEDVLALQSISGE